MMRRLKLHNGRDAFSLVEILVAIAILVSLLLVSLSVTGKLRERLAFTQCAHNLREVGMSVLAYATDHDNLIIPTRVTAEGSGNDPYWPWKLVKGGYLPQEPAAKVLTTHEFYCPSSEVPSPERAKEKLKSTSNVWPHVYGLRQWRVPGGSAHDVYKPMGAVANPHTFLLLADSVSTSTGLPWFSLGTGSNANTQRIHLRHDGRANCFFLDGRVVPMNASQLEENRESTAEYGWNPVFQWAE